MSTWLRPFNRVHPIYVQTRARLTLFLSGKSFIPSDPLWAEVYTSENGSLLVEGDTCYRKRYANLLEKISWYGPDFFYKGETAVNTAAAAHARGGILTVADLANYSAIVREPVNITYRNSRIFSTVAPSSGAVVLSALKIFEVRRQLASPGER